ncbi:MAG TPA: tol-pal system protein YbgF, partial [Thermoanaerobaculia bacterium]|nr:tol-pal system protein YbgF [Thermoanaerobaculia bacterium]
STDDDAHEPIVVPQAAPAPDPRIGEMQTQLTELLERIDVLNHRLARLEEGGGAVAAPAAVAPATVPAQPATPRPAADAAAAPQVTAAPQPQRALVGAKIAEDYRQAIMLFGRGRHADARRAFEEVFEADEHGDLADNALFWIGETYFAAGDYSNAMRFYARVIRDYPDQNKAPDALFKTAMAHVRTGDLALARSTLQQVIERYPYSSTASSAKAELQRIRF